MSLSGRNASIHPPYTNKINHPNISMHPHQVLAISIVGFGNCLYLIFQEDIEREDAAGAESPIRTRYVRQAAGDAPSACCVL